MLIFSRRLLDRNCPPLFSDWGSLLHAIEFVLYLSDLSGLSIKILAIDSLHSPSSHIMVRRILLKTKVAFYILKSYVSACYTLHASLLCQIFHLWNRLVRSFTLGRFFLYFRIPDDGGIRKHRNLLFIDILWWCNWPINDLIEVFGISEYLHLGVNWKLYFRTSNTKLTCQNLLQTLLI